MFKEIFIQYSNLLNKFEFDKKKMYYNLTQ